MHNDVADIAHCHYGDTWPLGGYDREKKKNKKINKNKKRGTLYCIIAVDMLNEK